MSIFYQKILKPILFSFEPETAHKLSLKIAGLADFRLIAKVLEGLYSFNDSRLEQKIFGINFKSPIGLAAGLDKDCIAVAALSSIGFDYLELGGVTAKEQNGNPRPRVFRLPEHSAIINRLGLPSVGAKQASSNLLFSIAETNRPPPIGVNIAKSYQASIDQAIPDYLETFSYFYDLCQFFVLNISCPNEANYQRLQEKERLSSILSSLQKANKQMKPLLVKLSPDLERQQLQDSLDACMENGIAAIICGNTTNTRPDNSEAMQQKGGLSGPLLLEKTLENVRTVRSIVGKDLPIIACGGISSAQDVVRAIKAGANLCQIYTALVYQGFSLIKDIKKDLCKYMDKEGIRNINEILPE
jgi:dihydroorotate dehydrogenase